MNRILNLTAGAVIGALFTLLSAFAGMESAEAHNPDHPIRTVRPCEYEDGSSMKECVWDAPHMGNGRGQSLLIVNGGEDNAKYIKITHHRAFHLLHAWHRVP